MLWRKHWREVRWVALAGALGLLAFGWDLLDKVGTMERQVGYIRPISFWSASWQYRSAALPLTLIIAAILLGIGGLGYERNAGTSVFTLSLPYTRRRLVVSRFLVGAVTLLALSIGGMAGVSGWAAIRGVGDQFPPLQAIGAGLCVAAVALMVYSFAFLAANVTANAVRSIATVVTAVIVLTIALTPHTREIPDRWTIAWFLRPLDFVELASGNLASGGDTARPGSAPWVAVLVALALTGALLVATVRWVERYDF